MLYSIDTKRSFLEFKQLVSLSIEPVSLCCDNIGGLWISTTDSQQSLLYLDLGAKKGVSPCANQKLVLDLAKTHQADSKSQESVDIYEVSKMRKWSIWKPKDMVNKEEGNKKRQVVDDGDESVEGLEVKKIKP